MTDSTAPALPALHHVQLAMPAGAEATARAFYSGLLGLPELPKPPHLTARGGCWFGLADRELHLGVEPDFRPARKAHPALLVPDLDGLRARLTAAGVATRDEADPPAGYRRFYADDPFGNRLEFLQREP
jgi:catechol 2,3-dioxygenase-like lactoylglutathione lyase family enzyme